MAMTACAAIVRERAHFSSIDADAADRRLLINHRNSKESADAAFVRTGYQHRVAFDVALFPANIGNVDWAPSSYRASRGGVRPWLQSGLHELREDRRYSKHNDRLDHAIVYAKEKPEVGFADCAWLSPVSRGRLGQARRTAN